jgi:hypothetical protein
MEQSHVLLFLRISPGSPDDQEGLEILDLLDRVHRPPPSPHSAESSPLYPGPSHTKHFAATLVHQMIPLPGKLLLSYKNQREDSLPVKAPLCPSPSNFASPLQQATERDLSHYHNCLSAHLSSLLDYKSIRKILL